MKFLLVLLPGSSYWYIANVIVFAEIIATIKLSKYLCVLTLRQNWRMRFSTVKRQSDRFSFRARDLLYLTMSLLSACELLSSLSSDTVVTSLEQESEEALLGELEQPDPSFLDFLDLQLSVSAIGSVSVLKDEVIVAGFGFFFGEPDADFWSCYDDDARDSLTRSDFDLTLSFFFIVLYFFGELIMYGVGANDLAF